MIGLRFLLIFVIFISVYFSFSFAICPQVLKIWDCWFVKLTDPNKISWNFKVVKSEDINVAISHLKQFCNCCSEWKCSSYKWAESPYLFDQLVDIVFRKLDWIQNLSYVKVDEDAKVWRDYIKKVWENPDWAIPEDIQKKFLKYRWRNWILYKKYLKACEEIATVVQSIWLTIWWVISSYKDTSFFYKKSILEDKCKQLFLERYDKEYNLVKYYMIRKWNQILSNYWQSYVKKDLVDKQWQRLLEKFSKFLWYLTRIVKLIGNWTKNCNM